MTKAKPIIVNTAIIFLGSLLLAVGINFFFLPSKICAGGISSIGTILYYETDGLIHLSYTNAVANLILLILGLKFLGKDAVLKSVIGVIALSISLEITSYIDIAQFALDPILSVIVGGVVAGLGMGLVVKRAASTGGTDFVALMLKRIIPHASVAGILLVLDCTIVIVSGIVFQNFAITVYSLIAMYVCSRVTDTVVSFGNKAKAVQVFSDKNEEIADFVINKFDRGATGVYAKGMYSKKDRTMLLCVVSPKELPLLINAIKKIDHAAFIIINDAKEVLGEGFKTKSDYDDISVKIEKN